MYSPQARVLLAGPVIRVAGRRSWLSVLAAARRPRDPHRRPRPVAPVARRDPPTFAAPWPRPPIHGTLNASCRAAGAPSVARGGSNVAETGGAAGLHAPETYLGIQIRIFHGAPLPHVRGRVWPDSTGSIHRIPPLSAGSVVYQIPESLSP